LVQTIAYPFWRDVVKAKEEEMGNFHAVDDHDNA
jgi:hypothetical protein